MTGLDQRAVWNGDESTAREHLIVENRHQPTTLHLKTYIDDRYKLTLYFDRDYGEIFDLLDDVGEVTNLYADQALRARLTEAMLRGEMLKEEPLTDDSLRLPNKSAAMHVKSANKGRYQINFDPGAGRQELFDLSADPARTQNLWQEPAFGQAPGGYGENAAFQPLGHGAALDAEDCRGLRVRRHCQRIGT